MAAGKRGRKTLSEAEMEAQAIERQRIIVKKVGHILDWLQSPAVKAAVIRHKALIIAAVPAKLAKEDESAPADEAAWRKRLPRICTFYNRTIAGWYTEAASRMATTACSMEEALFDTWPASASDDKSDANPDEGMFEEVAKIEFADPAEAKPLDINQLSIDESLAEAAVIGEHAAVEEPAQGAPKISMELTINGDNQVVPTEVEQKKIPKKASSVIKAPEPEPQQNESGLACHKGDCGDTAWYAIIEQGGFEPINACRKHWKEFVTEGASVWEINDKGEAVRELSEDEKIDGN